MSHVDIKFASSLDDVFFIFFNTIDFLAAFLLRETLKKFLCDILMGLN